MEITIRTVKLTTKIVNQMPIYLPIKLDNFEIIGLLRNIKKKQQKVILCKKNNEYFLLFCYAFKKYGLTKIFKDDFDCLEFNSLISRDEYFKKYQEIIKNTPQIYI